MGWQATPKDRFGVVGATPMAPEGGLATPYGPGATPKGRLGVVSHPLS